MNAPELKTFYVEFYEDALDDCTIGDYVIAASWYEARRFVIEAYPRCIFKKFTLEEE